MEKIDMFASSAQEIGITLDAKTIEKFITYKDILLEWNEKINLTTITDEVDIYIKHFIDSLTCIGTGYIKEDSSIIDVGTGAGFPGIPIKIINSSVKLTLLDSLNKRINYLKELVEKLELTDVNLLHARAEEAAVKAEHREQYDIVLSRAVASMNVLCEYCLPYAKVGGYFICQKGPKYRDELAEAQKAIKLLGGELKEVKAIQLPNSDITHYIIIIQKTTNTPTKYPRKPGKPAADPIK